MVDAVNATAKMGINVEWIDRVLRKISTKRDHFSMSGLTTQVSTRGTLAGGR